MNHEYAIHVLKLPDKFSAEQLRANYKRMALLLHPDRRTLDKESANSLFSILTESYKLLKAEGDGSSDADWMTLRAQADNRDNDRNQDRIRQPQNVSSSSFNIDGFNSKFSESRLEDDNDRGYTSWMQRLSPDAAAAQQKRQQDAVRNRSRKEEDASLALREPEALPSSTTIPHSELGSGRVKDFGRSTSDVAGLSYTDYKVAHMSASCLIDPETVKARHQFDTIEEFERSRCTSHSASMTPIEKAAIARNESVLASREDRRLNALQRRDDLVARHHATLNNVLR